MHTLAYVKGRTAKKNGKADLFTSGTNLITRKCINKREFDL